MQNISVFFSFQPIWTHALFVFHLVVDSSDDFADEFEGQSPELSPLPLQSVRADQSLTHHPVKTPLHSQSHEEPDQEQRALSLREVTRIKSDFSFSLSSAF